MSTPIDALIRFYQRHRRPAPGGGVEAVIDDYRVARALLVDSFSAAAGESLTAGIREIVSEIDAEEEITRPQLRGLFPMKPRSTFYHHVRKALDLHFLREERRGGTLFLGRNRPLPDERPPLPNVEEVEGLFVGVPAPIRSEWFLWFIDDFQKFGGTDGVTAAEWAAWVGQPLTLVRERLDVLVEGGTLLYDNRSERYAVCVVVQPVASPPASGTAASPTTPASNSSPGRNSPAEQPNPADVQASNGSARGTRAEDATMGSASDTLLPAQPVPLASRSQSNPETGKAPKPSATKLPPLTGGS